MSAPELLPCPECGEPLRTECSSCTFARAAPSPAASEDAEAAFEAWHDSHPEWFQLENAQKAVRRAAFHAGRASAPWVKPYDIDASNKRQSEFYRAAGGRQEPEDELRRTAQGEEENDDA